MWRPPCEIWFLVRALPASLVRILFTRFLGMHPVNPGSLMSFSNFSTCLLFMVQLHWCFALQSIPGRGARARCIGARAETHQASSSNSNRLTLMAQRSKPQTIRFAPTLPAASQFRPATAAVEVACSNAFFTPVTWPRENQSLPHADIQQVAWRQIADASWVQLLVARRTCLNCLPVLFHFSSGPACTTGAGLDGMYQQQRQYIHTLVDESRRSGG